MCGGGVAWRLWYNGTSFAAHTLPRGAAALTLRRWSPQQARCLSSGIPCIVVPILLWSDQPFWGHRVEQLGYGRVLSQAVPPQDTFRRAIREVVTDEAMRRNVQAAAARMNAEAGTVAATLLVDTCLCRRVRASSAVVTARHAGASSPQCVWWTRDERAGTGAGRGECTAVGAHRGRSCVTASRAADVLQALRPVQHTAAA